MQRLFCDHPTALQHAYDLSQQMTFSLDALRYEYPSEINGHETPSDRLVRLAQAGLKWRYPYGASDKVRGMLAHELALFPN